MNFLTLSERQKIQIGYDRLAILENFMTMGIHKLRLQARGSWRGDSPNFNVFYRGEERDHRVDKLKADLIKFFSSNKKSNF